MPTGEVVNAYNRRIYVDPDDSRGRALIRSRGDFNPLASALWRLALELRPRWDCVLDVGANYGEMIAGADLSTVDRVVAFEPNPVVADRLRRTVAALPWPVELRETAVGATAGSVRFAIDPKWSGKSHVAADSDAGAISVDMTSIDDVLREDFPKDVAVKIDVEGLELDVLEGMRELRANADLVVVMLEILHMSVQQVAVLTRTTPVYLMTTEDARLVRLPTDDPMRTGIVLHDGSTHRENALIILGTGADDFVAGTPALANDAVPASSPEAVDLRQRLRVRERELRELRRFTERRSVRAVAGVADRLAGLRERRP